MRIFLAYEGERHIMDVDDGAKVKDVRKEVQARFMIGGDQAGKPDRKVVVFSYAGADLKDDWVFTDIGINPGTTIRINEREEIKPRLFVLCSHNNEVVQVMDEIDVVHSTVSDLRSIVSRRTGLPVGVFRLVDDRSKQELFDCHQLDNYNFQIGDKVLLETWDGWTDFINLSIMGFSGLAMKQISSDDTIGRFQMKVALYLSAHYGHQELAITLLKQGVRSDVPVGYHPSRQWCDDDRHIDSWKAPIHECAEQGKLNVLKTFVNYSLVSIVAKEGNDKTAFQLALRNKQKPCAGFLLAKQWSRIQYGQTDYTIPLKMYAKIKDWCERAKDKVFIVYGQSKSSLKRRPFVATSGTLVGLGVSVDGYGDKRMNGKPVLCQSPTAVERRNRSYLILPTDQQRNQADQYFKHAQRSLSNLNASMRKASKGNLRQKFEDDHGSRPVSGANAYQGRQSQQDDVDRNNNDVANRNKNKSDKPSTILEESSATNDADKHSVLHSNNADEKRRPTRSRKQKKRYKPKIVQQRPPKNAIFDMLAGGGGGGLGLKPEGTDDGIKLPKINGASNMTGGKSAFIQTGQVGGDGEGANKTANDAGGPPKLDARAKQTVNNAMKIAQASQGEGAIPLPVVSLENKTRPYFHHVRSASDPAISTLTLYEQYRGVQARDYAIKCLSIASNFKDKPWLQQVRLAMTLTAQGVKKVVKSNNGLFKHHEEP